jgi:two-component system, OmpR family, sensor kinase
MRSLFVRILLSFWLMGGIVLIAGMAVYWVAPPRPDLRPILAELVRPRATAALEALARGDRAGAERELDELSALGGPRVTLVDPSGTLLGPSDAEVLEIAGEARATGGIRGTTLDESELIAVPIHVAGRDAASSVIAVGVTPRFPRLRSTAYTARIVTLLVVSGIVAFFLARSVARPIEAVRRASAALAEGDTSVRVSSSVVGRKDELSALAHDFDRMAERIAELLDAQTRLLLDVSHELRSPLARLTVGIELARQKVGPDGQAALDRMEREAERLAELVSEVLTLARLEHRERGTEEDVPLGPLLRELTEAAEFEAAAKGRHVALSGPLPASIVRGDEELLRRALENVLRNAVRFTSDGTTVEVRTELEGTDRVRIVVRDHGPGVPEETLEGIFRPFYRVGTARDRATGGTGLGLAITDRAIRAHHGTVSARNAEDGGLMVTLELPVQHVPAPAGEAALEPAASS